MSLTLTVSKDAAERLGMIVTQQRESDDQGLRIFAQRRRLRLRRPLLRDGHRQGR